MISTFAKYALRTFFWHFFLLWLSFTALLQLFDLLNNGDDVLKQSGGGLRQLMEYAFWRVPELAAFLIPFSVLLGALLSLGKLERNNEILAFKAAGAPYYLVLASFLPAVGLAGLLHFAIADQVVPYSVSKLISANLYPDKNSKSSDGEGNDIWIQDGMTVVEAQSVSHKGSILHGVMLYQRGNDGNLQILDKAATAVFDLKDKIWNLNDVWRTTVLPDQAAQTAHFDKATWQSRLTPAEFSNLVEQPQAMPISKIWRFVSTDQIGVRPTYFYETWLQKRIALPVASILMILLAAPVAQSLQRRDRSMAAGIAIGFLLGFLYFITDGLVMSLGETGAVPPFFAAWLPPLLFASIGGVMLIRLEGY
ncbi:MAG: LPS export ABC transporter permease LptG [Rhodospirillaceae bacterium]|nr:MAG: LPS export ABC transporter permease LptG [Rhodospirillaceae bacterium]